MIFVKVVLSYIITEPAEQHIVAQYILLGLRQTQDLHVNQSESCTSTVTHNRTVALNFDWKNCCFICGELCHTKKRNTWSMVETAVDKTKPNIYMKVLEAEQKLQDNNMRAQICGLSNKDLVAAEAR